MLRYINKILRILSVLTLILLVSWYSMQVMFAVEMIAGGTHFLQVTDYLKSREAVLKY